MSNPAYWFDSDKWNSHNSGHLSSVLLNHHFTLLWGPLPLLSSDWLSTGPYGTMYSVIVQCIACIFYSLFVWSMILSKPKLKLILTSIIQIKPLKQFIVFGPYGTMYSVIVQCNACTFYSLFVWVMILAKPKSKTFLREIIKR